jgi:hypothetical protein
MPMNMIHFQTGISLSQFLELYETEEQCKAAQEQTSWLNVFRCPHVENKSMVLVHGRRHSL